MFGLVETVIGIALSFHVANFEVTEYVATGNLTATGTQTIEGRTVSVDPDVISLGSWIFIEGFGWRHAEDTGGAVDGYIVDVFVGSYDEAINWGRRDRIIVWRD